MRLLNVHSRVLGEFFGENIPKYAILSHTWGEEEVSFQDLQRADCVNMLGYGKIEGCCRLALDQGFDWVWVDTCCIDKTSSAELSEAINSMFRWYQHSSVCYVHLSDVSSREDPRAKCSSFRRSRWFTRGWTLQELLAPRSLQFYDTAWYIIDLSHSLDARDRAIRVPRNTLLEEVTGIDAQILESGHIKDRPIATRLSWAAQRKTTREEDMAYCLLGVVGVNMPLLYGEGKTAFTRLQEHIISVSPDLSLLAWGLGRPVRRIGEGATVLAQSPMEFMHCSDLELFQNPRNRAQSHSMVTSHGLNLELPIFSTDELGGLTLGLLNYYMPVKQTSKVGNQVVAIPLLHEQGTQNSYKRHNQSQPVLVSETLFRKSRRRLLYIQDSYEWIPNPPNTSLKRSSEWTQTWKYKQGPMFRLRPEQLETETGLSLREIHPQQSLLYLAMGPGMQVSELSLAMLGSPLWWPSRAPTIYLRFANDKGIHRKQRGHSIFVSIRAETMFWRTAKPPKAVTLAQTSNLTLLEYILALDREQLLWKPTITVPITTAVAGESMPESATRNISVRVERAMQGLYIQVK